MISQWAAAIGCGPTPRHRVISGQIREARYVDAEGFAAVRLIAVADAEHSWPGTQHGDHIKQFGAPGSWDASQAHWHFVHEVERNDIRVTAHGDDRPLRGNVTEGDEGTTTVPPR